MGTSLKYVLTFLVVLEISCHKLLLISGSATSGGLVDNLTNSRVYISIIYPISGLFLVFILIYSLSRLKTRDLAEKLQSKFQLPLWIFLSLIALLIQHYVEIRLEDIPIDYKHADMLPVIKVMSLRFLSGSDVYAIIPEIWGGMQPIYLPGMWMPYILPLLFKIDMRWVSVLWMFGGTLLLYYGVPRKELRFISVCLLSITLIWLWISILSPGTYLITHSEEGIVIGYYLVLFYAILNKKWALTGIAIGLCLLSRYALLTWAISFVIGLMIYANRKYALRVFTFSLCTIIFLMLVTRAYEHLDIFIGLPDQYLHSVMSNPDKYLPVINESLGIAKFVDIDHFPILHLIFKIIIIIIPALGFLVYKFLKKTIRFELYALCLLKITLIAFYNLILLPYPYLFYTSTFLSLALLSVGLFHPGYKVNYKT